MGCEWARTTLLCLQLAAPWVTIDQVSAQTIPYKPPLTLSVGKPLELASLVNYKNSIDSSLLKKGKRYLYLDKNGITVSHTLNISGILTVERSEAEIGSAALFVESPPPNNLRRLLILNDVKENLWGLYLQRGSNNNNDNNLDLIGKSEKIRSTSVLFSLELNEDGTSGNLNLAEDKGNGDLVEDDTPFLLEESLFSNGNRTLRIGLVSDDPVWISSNRIVLRGTY